MFPKNKMVLEKLYTGVCNVYEKEKVKKPNGSTAFETVKKYSDIKCRLSYASSSTSTQTSTTDNISQVIKLFLDNSLKILEGSTIEVTQNEVTNVFVSSGKPAVYSNHQEIVLVLGDKYA